MSESINQGYGAPASPALAKAQKTLARAETLMAPPEERHDAAPVARNYANDVYIEDGIDTDEIVMDLTSSNVHILREMEAVDPARFREFETQAEYERFMNDPIVIMVHETRDKSEPPLVFVGVNGDERWLPRNRKVRLQRKFVERLAQAQEMLFRTEDDPDPRADMAKKITQRSAAAYAFSVLHDPSPNGRRWLARVTRQGT